MIYAIFPIPYDAFFLQKAPPPKWPCVWTPEYQIVKKSLSVLGNYRVRLITRSVLRGGKCGKLGATNTFVKGITNVTYVVIIPAGWWIMQWLLQLPYVTARNDVNWFNINVRLFMALTNDNKPHGWNKTGWHLRGISSPSPPPHPLMWRHSRSDYRADVNLVNWRIASSIKMFLISGNTNAAEDQQVCVGTAE